MKRTAQKLVLQLLRNPEFPQFTGREEICSTGRLMSTHQLALRPFLSGLRAQRLLYVLGNENQRTLDPGKSMKR